MVRVYDLSDNPLSYKNGSYSGLAGNKDGILIEGECWLVKYPKDIRDLVNTGGASYSTAPLSEFLGSHIYKILGYDVHETILAERKNKIVVACKDFVGRDSILLEFRTIKNHVNEDSVRHISVNSGKSESSNCVELSTVLECITNSPILQCISGIAQRFWDQAIIDIFINNNDRNGGNWGILRRITSQGYYDTLAPIFDNGASFLTKSSEKKIQRQLEDEELLRSSALSVQTAYSYDGHKYYAPKFLSLVEEYNGLCTAIVKLVPLLHSKLLEIFRLIDSIPEEYTLRNGTKVLVCSQLRKELYKRHLSVRLQELLEPAYIKARELSLNKSALDVLNKIYVDNKII